MIREYKSILLAKFIKKIVETFWDFVDNYLVRLYRDYHFVALNLKKITPLTINNKHDFFYYI